MTKWEKVQHIRRDIAQFKAQHDLDHVTVVWTANTERFCEIQPGVHDTADHLLQALEQGNDTEVSPSTLFAIASILEQAPFVNGSPQNTLVPGVVQLAERHGVLIGGDDFKSGQTKLKSVLVDFLVSSLPSWTQSRETREREHKEINSLIKNIVSSQLSLVPSFLRHVSIVQNDLVRTILTAAFQW